MPHINMIRKESLLLEKYQFSVTRWNIDIKSLILYNEHFFFSIKEGKRREKERKNERTKEREREKIIQ